MPKTNVNSPHDDGRRVEVGWHSNGWVQIGTTVRQPVKADSQPQTATTATVGHTVDPDGWAWDGQHTDLDRTGINRLIKALREARDKAYGRDE